MTTETRTPFDRARVIELGRLTFEKQLLPIGSIEYEGETIEFDRPYLDELAEAFHARAFDQVPFVLANDQNAHNEDPERFRAELTDVVRKDDGLYGILSFANEEAARVVRENPKLGISARIIEGLRHADGRSFKRAIRHVLGTLDPVITGMQPWQAIELSGYTRSRNAKVVDLTDRRYRGDNVAHFTEEQIAELREALGIGDQLADAGEMSDQEFEDALAEVLGQDAPDEDDEADDEADDDEADEAGDEQGAQGGGEQADEKPLAGVSLSAADRRAIDLANTRAEQAEDRARAIERDLAAERFNAEARTLVESGIPPVLVDLARPILSRPESVVLDFSREGGGKVDATKTIRDMLLACEGMVDLSDARGHGVDKSASEEATEKALLDSWQV